MLKSSKTERVPASGWRHILTHGMATALFAAQLAGCAMPKTPTYEPNKKVGETYCAELAQRSQLVSTQEMGVGIFLLTVAGGSITASGAIGTINGVRDSPSDALAYLGGGLAVLPLIAVPFGMVMLSRSDEASALSAAANTSLALSDDDEEAYRNCVLAKASWVGSRADATALAREAMSDDGKKKKKKEADEGDEKGGEKGDEPEASDGDDGAKQDLMTRVQVLLNAGRVEEAQKLLKKQLDGSPP
jgi:hypothetical protein